ncbi:MAG: hypothetical protein VYB54_07725 [Pseudomonadota bacterium]|nr:hypothetical protein [Pseudomonadota bacterium]
MTQALHFVGFRMAFCWLCAQAIRPFGGMAPTAPIMQFLLPYAGEWWTRNDPHEEPDGEAW